MGMGDPFFCKYLCPAGILEGGIPLSLADTGIRASLGWLFTWKSCILLGVVVLSVFFYRPFCKWLCPLGAFLRPVQQDLGLSAGGRSKQMHLLRCVQPGVSDGCGRIPHTQPAECIRCGDCVAACPHQAITKTFSLKKQTNKKETI